MVIKHVHLDQQGINLFVGTLEATLLRALWEQSRPLTMANLYRYLIRECYTEASYSAIITTLNRMADKRYIIRTERENSTPLWYKAFENEDHFIEACMIDTLNVLHANYADHFLAYVGA